MQSRSALAALGFAAAAVAALLLLVARGPSREPRASGGERPLVTMFRPILVAYDETGAKVLEIVCRVAKIARDGHTYLIEGLERATLFREGEPAMVLRADSGSYNEITRDAQLSGNVKALSADGFLFETDVVSWVYRQQAVLVPGALRLKFGEMRVQTESARYSLPDQILECPKAVEASTTEDRLRGDRLRVEGKAHRAVLQGNVTVASAHGVAMRGNEVWYDYAARRAWTAGEVQVTYRSVQATSRNVEYLAGDNILRCPERVTATLGPDQLSADSLIVDGVRRRAAFNGDVKIVFEPESAEARLAALRRPGGRRG